jgi:hypothetical protein
VAVTVSNLDPWNRPPATTFADQIFLVSPQAGLDIGISPFGYGQPASGGTSWSHTYDWLAFGAGNGLPVAAKGDAVIAYQRTYFPLPDSPVPGRSQLLRLAKKNALLSGVTGVSLADGVAGSLSAALVDAPFTETATVDARNTQFAALAPLVNPNATPTAFNGLFIGLAAVPHSADFPADLSARVRLVGLFLDGGAPDTVHGPYAYGGFLDTALWKEWWTVGASYDVPVTAPGAAPATFTLNAYSDVAKVGPSVTIAPAVGPVAAPKVNGLDAFTAQPAATLQPVLSWSPPALGSPTSYIVAIYRLDNVAGATSWTNVFFVQLRSTSLMVPPGPLAAGSSYFAVIQAYQAPWDLPDTGPYLDGATRHSMPCVTAAFTP